jgi:putative membrane protein
MLTELDKDRIAQAIEAAEQGTSGDVVCALTGEVSTYREVPLAWGAAVALTAPPIALALGLRPLALAGQAGVWLAAQGAALENELAVTLGLYAVAQLMLFVAVALLVRVPQVRRALTPRSLKSHRVDRAARHHFTALAASARGSETGVLIFVAVEDRQVRILAAPSLHEKADETAWTRAANAIGAAMKAGHDPTRGIVEAIEICGAALKAHFPAAEGEAHAFSARPMDV